MSFTFVYALKTLYENITVLFPQTNSIVLYNSPPNCGFDANLLSNKMQSMEKQQTFPHIEITL